jgi:integrase
MGTIYQRKEFYCRTCQRKRPNVKACRAAGHTIDERAGSILWIKYSRNGKAYAESSESTRHGEAKKLLAKREGDIAHGKRVTNKIGRLSFEDAAKDLLADYTTNGKRSYAVVERRVRKHLTPFFAGRRMAEISPVEIREYIQVRQTDLSVLVRKAHTVDDCEIPEEHRPASNAEINRELALLKRMFSLALDAEKLLHRPKIPMLAERNVRTGFFEREPYLSVLTHLPEEIRPVIEFAYLTGWRIASEVLPLEWHRVDFDAGEIRLDAGTTKNGEGRTFPLTIELRQLLKAQDAERERLKKAGHICPYVFFREIAEGRGGEKKPQRIVSFAKAWKAACRAAGCPGRLPHDLRRTAIRNFVRNGVPERVAMQLTGHKTRSVFERYNIVSEGDLRAAARKLDDVRDAGMRAATT